VDVLPTLLELSGSARPATIRGAAVPLAPGRSLAGVFAKDDPILPGYLWWQHENHRAIRAGDWKLVALRGGEWELYDLSRDRGESNNLASAQPERVRALSALWEKQSLENTSLALGDRPARPREVGLK